MNEQQVGIVAKIERRGLRVDIHRGANTFACHAIDGSGDAIALARNPDLTTALEWLDEDTAWRTRGSAEWPD
jgi:hypothetical protein